MRITGSERFFGVLGYLPILFLLSIKGKRDSMFVQFHARQGAVLFLLWLVVAILCVILLVIPVIGANQIASVTVMGLLFLATFLYGFMGLVGIFKVLLGERYRMPVVADVALMMRL